MKLNKLIAAALASTFLFTAGCKQYEQPEFIEVKANETAYVIPLEDSAEKGVKFDSEDYLDKKKVALKRIPIPHRWNKTGRMYYDGEWMDTVRVITVDRSPVTRNWDSDKKSKTAVWVESADSIGFSTGFSVTAYVEETDTSRFLYSYKATSLSEVLDSELRARIQSVASDFCAKHKMDILREKKVEMMEAIKADVVPFFKAKGITITTIGQFGGLEYGNEKIQASIDDTFVAQQAKVKNAALLEAQSDANKKIELEATAMAEAARSKAKGEADGKLMVFKAEAEGLQAVNKALAEANQNPALVEFKRIEVMRSAAEKWNGQLPVWVTGAANSLFQMPSPPTK